MSIFAALDVYHDDAFRAAALNMALDEALLETATSPALRFYRWDHPALSFGYFGKFAHVTEFDGRDYARRWTGGGIVLHGEDLTYAIVVPANDAAFAESSMSIYEKTHRAIQQAIGNGAELSPVAGIADPGAAVGDRGYNKEACFANAVRADVMMNGRKIAGAAQRRTRRGLLQQGSIQHVDLAQDFAERFARGLSAKCVTREIDHDLLERAREIAQQKYASEAWLRRR